jgi:hypothetical protein
MNLSNFNGPEKNNLAIKWRKPNTKFTIQTEYSGDFSYVNYIINKGFRKELIKPYFLLLKLPFL